MNIQLYKNILYISVLTIQSMLISTVFKLGVENIPASLPQKICPHKKKDLCMLGLITNQSGVDQKGNRTIDILT